MLSRAVAVNAVGHLEIAGCDSVSLAKQYGTPLYIMNEDIIRLNCRRYKNAFDKSGYPNWRVAYAGKAFLSAWICQVIGQEGLNLDVVSGGELYTALRAGFPAQRIVFHGSNKSRDEVMMGLEARVGRFVVDNNEEIDIIQRAAKKLRVKARVLLRVTPGVEAHTHEYVETGVLDTKFGFNIDNGDALRAVEKVMQCDRLTYRGIHCHIGSQITRLDGPRIAAERVVEFMRVLSISLGLNTPELDLGGGLGVRYVADDDPPTIDRYIQEISSTVRSECERAGLELPVLVVEPGRSIVAEAGTTLYTVGAIKKIPGVRTYVSVDGGMTDNPRYALYGAQYEAIVANRASSAVEQSVCLAGKCCESGDIVIKQAQLAACDSGDLIAVFGTGAYNYSMASNYNRITRPAVVAVSKGNSRLVVRRETFEDLVATDCMLANSSKQAVAQN